MNFLKLVKYDIKQGFLYNKVKFIVLAGIIAAFCIAFKVDATQYTNVNRFTLGDYILYIIEGARQLPMDEIKNYMMPVNWLSIQVLIAYIVGYYATDDMNTYGQHILMRSSSRSKWFISKCIWNICMVILAYIVLYSVTLIFAAAMGEDLNIIITDECVENYVYKTRSVNVADADLVLMLFFMPFLVSATISLLQMVVSMMASPIVGFIVGQAIIFGSTLFPNKLFIGNYSMFAKNEVNGMTDINIYEGIGICSVIMILTLVVGIRYFNRCNMLSRE